MADRANEIKIKNATDTLVNPATEEKQDSLIAAFTSYATRIAESGNYTYVGKAAAGTATSAASWQIMRVDEGSGVIIQFADGDTDFNNIWDNYTTLIYS
jgi:hypothetical protein